MQLKTRIDKKEKNTNECNELATRELSTPPRGVFTPKTFLTPQHHPPLEVLRVLSRTLIRSMIFSAVGGYCSSLNYYSCVY